MIRRLTLSRPAPDGAAGDAERVVRFLAVSDEPEPSLERPDNREALGRLDAILGCGDLDPAYLAFVADAFAVPLLYVLGNHDRGGGWDAERHLLPDPIKPGETQTVGGVAIVGFGWPTTEARRYTRDEGAAWRQVLPVAFRHMTRRSRPAIVLSHVAPLGAGDTPDDPFHVGFAAYRWLALRLSPELWLHGHTATAAAPAWRSRLGATEVVNVTGAVLIELVAGDSADGPPAERERMSLAR